ncbi:SRPBCC domain-containing protein [bacterium]|nr:SRPBCC domain-containing protein [bacterium]
MIKEKQTTPTRSIERALEIDAPVEKVWKALTDAKELTRWFPLDAKVTPGKGGSIFYSWGPPYEGNNEIEIWEPNQRLKMADRWSEHSHSDKIQETAGGPAQVAMDFKLESRGGKTILRLVHSGFGTGEDWEDEFDATSRGWTFELNNLKQYVENHEGATRQVVWARTLLLNTREEVWFRMMSENGFLLEGSIENLSPGDSYSIKTPGGFELKGRVIANKPPLDFYGTVGTSTMQYFVSASKGVLHAGFHAIQTSSS